MSGMSRKAKSKQGTPDTLLPSIVGYRNPLGPPSTVYTPLFRPLTEKFQFLP